MHNFIIDKQLIDVLSSDVILWVSWLSDSALSSSPRQITPPNGFSSFSLSSFLTALTDELRVLAEIAAHYPLVAGLIRAGPLLAITAVRIS